MGGEVMHCITQPGKSAKENDGPDGEADAAPAAAGQKTAANRDATAGAEKWLVFVIELTILSVAKRNIAEIGPV